jgi:hypothetical protein
VVVPSLRTVEALIRPQLPSIGFFGSRRGFAAVALAANGNTRLAASALRRSIMMRLPRFRA